MLLVKKMVKSRDFLELQRVEGWVGSNLYNLGTYLHICTCLTNILYMNL